MPTLITTTLPGLGIGYVCKVGYMASPGANYALLELKTGNDIGLSASARFSEGTVVLNSYINGNWGKEERPTGFPLVIGQQLSVIVIVLPTEFEIQAVQEGTENQPWVYKYQHRLPASFDVVNFTAENVTMKDFFVTKAF